MRWYSHPIGRPVLPSNLRCYTNGLWETLDQARAVMAKLAYQRVERTCNKHLVPTSYGFDVSHFRTYGEISYEAALASFIEREFHGPDLLTKPYMLLWSRPILRAEFRYLQRSSMQYHFDRRVQLKRSTRSRHGYLLPYPHVYIE